MVRQQIWPTTKVIDLIGVVQDFNGIRLDWLWFDNQLEGPITPVTGKFIPLKRIIHQGFVLWYHGRQPTYCHYNDTWECSTTIFYARIRPRTCFPYRIRKIGVVTYQIIWVRTQSLDMFEVRVGYSYRTIWILFSGNSLNSVFESQKEYEGVRIWRCNLFFGETCWIMIFFFWNVEL